MVIVSRHGKRYTCKAIIRHQDGGEFLPCPLCVPIPRWTGSIPDHCEICEQSFEGVFIDGKTFGGPWALMCHRCHITNGGELGLGKGQMYDLLTLEKIEG